MLELELVESDIASMFAKAQNYKENMYQKRAAGRRCDNLRTDSRCTQRFFDGSLVDENGNAKAIWQSIFEGFVVR